MRHSLAVIASFAITSIVPIGLSRATDAPANGSLGHCIHEDDPIYFGPEGLIVHMDDLNHDGQFQVSESDYGDTAQREGWYWFGKWIRDTKLNQPWTDNPPRQLTIDQVLALLEPDGNGVFRRAPKYDPYSDYGLTHDQLVPLVAAMGAWGRKEPLQRLWDALPEDFAGKHAFGPDGRWLNVFGQPMSHCDDIKKRGCSPQGDCSLKVDTTDCSPQEDARDCSLKVDTRDCSLQEDTRDCSRAANCGHDGCPCEVRGCPGSCPDSCSDQCACPQGCGPEWWKCSYQRVCVADLNCAAAKADCERIKAPEEAACGVLQVACNLAKGTQNDIYRAVKAKCEAEKAAQNVLYVADKAKCESEKATQNTLYTGQKAGCEIKKSSQNALYKVEHDACETKKTINKFLCEGDKAAAAALCYGTQFRFTGDLIGPSTVNTFIQAGVDPRSSNPLVNTEVSLYPLAGDTEILVNVGILRDKAQYDRDFVDPDLNLGVQILMSRIFAPNPANQAAVAAYQARAHSYGSYFKAYCSAYGPMTAAEMKHATIRNRIEAGIQQGWAPDVNGPYGALRWYHRWTAGSNPKLAAMYQPILES